MHYLCPIQLKMVYNNTSTPVEVSVPYRSGFLAFHEIEFFMEQYEKLQTKRPDLIPQITMIDGNGIYHERRCGAASHYGLKANIPTIGVAKKFKCLPDDGIEKDEYRKRFCQMDTRGSIDIVTGDKEVLGKAALNTDIVRNPIFISIGHRCSLQTCMEVVLKCSRYRIPEPIRIADKLSREKVKSSPVV
uniref:Endonuclease V n=1 Tax=Ciona savignyi TaxID=51511 RepID=H2ZIR2_CIOSA